MRFWSKTKHGEKKLSREKQASMIEAGEKHGRKKIFISLGFHRFFVRYPKNACVYHPAPAEGHSPPRSPDLEAASPRIIKDSKENKEPSPKMKRRRSLKISSINLEPTQWQNDALHILTSTHDYRSMNDFLIKKARPHAHTHTHTCWDSRFSRYPCESHIPLKNPFQISDLESEDGKKDTMVDVVFKKALKEFRINIFNSYSTALAVSFVPQVLSRTFTLSPFLPTGNV